MAHVITQILFLTEDFLWMWGVLQMDVTKNKKRIAACTALLSLFLFCEGTLNRTDDFVPFEILTAALLAGFIFEGKIGVVQFKFWFMIFSMDFISGPIALIFRLAEIYTGMPWKEMLHGVIYEGTLILAMLLLTGFIKKRKLLKYKIKKLPLRYFVIGFIICFSGSFLNVFVIVYGRGAAEIVKVFSEVVSVGLSVGIYLLAISLLVANDLRRQYQKENQTKNQHLEMLKEYYRMQDEHIQEVYKIRHDIKNHLMVVREYLEQNKMEEAKVYLKQVETGIQRATEKNLNVGNDVVSAILSSEKAKAGETVSFRCEGQVPAEKQISDYDLCVIFSNLLSNAREACERLEKTEKQISILLKTYQGRFYISVENPVEWQVDTEKLGKFTSKEDKRKHGFGLQNVMETVEKNSGEIFFEATEGKFRVKILI